MEENLKDILEGANSAAKVISSLDKKRKEELLLCMADKIRKNKENILKANQMDYNEAKSKGMSEALLDRLLLNSQRIESMIKGVEDTAKLKDPIGEIEDMHYTEKGLLVGKLRVPLGTIGVIYESRPNVTADAAAVAIKAGNSVILRGGREAINSNLSIVAAQRAALKEYGIPEAAISFLASPDYQVVKELVRSKGKVDLVIIRAGKKVQEEIMKEATVPTMEHGEGNCHVYVDSYANLDMAEEIVYNAKVQRPAVCNAAEKLLVHKSVANSFLPRIVKRLQEANVEIRGCENTINILKEGVIPAKEEDWYEEYLALIIAIKIVDSIESAIEHINKYGSKHSEAIVTSSLHNAWHFLRRVDAAAVYVNASTRFTDGTEFNLGTEIGISTQKLHARGPMSVKELTTYKFIVFGEGQIRT